MANRLAMLSIIAVLGFPASDRNLRAQDTAPVAPAAEQGSPDKPVGPAKPGYVKGPKGKDVWVRSNDIVVLAPTPMLDEEGKQRLDTDGKPIFNPPVKQQRDKKGHPLFDEKGAPVFQTAGEMGYDDKGKHLHAEKIRPPKTVPVVVSRGTFTVDGVIAKAGLNYDIADLKYIYLFVPGTGVTVVSNEPFAGATLQPDAFAGSTLRVKAGDRILELAGDKKLMSNEKEKKTLPAYVRVDRNFQLPSRYPQVGYGTVARPPYQWPGSKANKQLNEASDAPPVPKNLEPTKLLSPCPAGQMRMPAPPILPGQKVPDQPCVPIAQAQAALKALDAKDAKNLTSSTTTKP